MQPSEDAKFSPPTKIFPFKIPRLLQIVMKNNNQRSTNPSIVPGSIEATILMGLRNYGRKKTFAEILDEAGIANDDNRRLEAATSLEASGLIEEVSYQLPVTIRADLTSTGKEVANALKQNTVSKFWFRNLGERWGLF
jgi:hypothetical protein